MKTKSIAFERGASGADQLWKISRSIGQEKVSAEDRRCLFGENVTTFERIWYGMHQVDRELVLRFAANVKTLRATGGES